MATVFLDAKRTAVIDYLEHSSTLMGTFFALIIRKVRSAPKEMRRSKL